MTDLETKKRSRKKEDKTNSSLELKKMLLSKMSDCELGRFIKEMEKMINLNGYDIYGSGLYLACQECIRRLYTTDENIIRVQNLMIKSFLRKNGFDDSVINEIIKIKK